MNLKNLLDLGMNCQKFRYLSEYHLNDYHLEYCLNDCQNELLGVRNLAHNL